MTNQYLNPLTVLSLADTDPDSLKKAKRRKLMEFDLSDDGTIEIDSQKITKNDFLTIAELLESPLNVEFFGLLKSELYLLEEFLSRGEINFFKLYAPQAIFKSRGFMQFVRPFYLPQFSKTLLQTYKDNNTSLLKQLFKPTEFIAATDEDAAYTALYQHINQQIKALEDIAPSINKDNSQYHSTNLNNIFSLITPLIKPDTLNILPTYFQSQRNNIALTINQIGAAIFNKHELFPVPLQLLALAKILQIDKTQRDTINDNIKQLEGMQQKAQQEAEAVKLFEQIFEIISLVIKLDEKLDNQQIRPYEVVNQLTQALNFAQINALPANMPELENWRDNVAMRVRSMSVEVYNKHDDSENAEKIIELALRFKVSSATAKRIAEDKQALLIAKREKAAAKDKQAREFLEILNDMVAKLRNLRRNEIPNAEAITNVLRELFTHKYMQNLGAASYGIRQQIAQVATNLMSHLASYQRRDLEEKLYLHLGSDVANIAEKPSRTNSSVGKDYPKEDNHNVPFPVKVLFICVVIVIILLII